MGRKKVPAVRVMIRVNPGDKELMDELCEVTGMTLAELCRRWIEDRASVERVKVDNAKAVKLMEGFLGAITDEALKSGVTPDQLLQMAAPPPPLVKARSSNTGPNVAVLQHKRGSDSVQKSKRGRS